VTSKSEKKQVGLLGIPFDGNSSFETGPALAPEKIRKVLDKGSLNKGTENGINLKDNPLWLDCGDILIKNDDEFLPAIKQGCDELLKQNIRLLTLGGDHSISYPIITSYAKYFPNLTILHIDAHSDLYDSFNGNRLSNACPFARIMEDKLCQRLVQMGIRTLNEHQYQQAERFKVEIIEMKNWHSGQVPNLSGPVYLSLDIDGLDPAFAPGVSHREPGGFSTREIINIIHRMGGELVGADLVEFNPIKDIDEMTSQLSAKLVKEIAGKMLSSL